MKEGGIGMVGFSVGVIVGGLVDCCCRVLDMCNCYYNNSLIGFDSMGAWHSVVGLGGAVVGWVVL